MKEQCEKVLWVSGDLGTMSTFRCQGKREHKGKHYSKGVSNLDRKDVEYRITWKSPS